MEATEAPQSAVVELELTSKPVAESGVEISDVLTNLGACARVRVLPCVPGGLVGLRLAAAGEQLTLPHSRQREGVRLPLQGAPLTHTTVRTRRTWRGGPAGSGWVVDGCAS